MSLTASLRFPASHLHPSVSADLSPFAYFLLLFTVPISRKPHWGAPGAGTDKGEGPGRCRGGPAGPKAAGTFAQAAGPGVQQLLRRLEAGGGEAGAQGGGQR